jgi:beta-phosphoglucomutase-like phosphatase (HAD superfamily)
MGHMSLAPVPPSLTLPGPWQAVVFDLDGLLVHTERQWLEAKQELFERYGRELSEIDKATVFGMADLQTVTYFAGRLDVAPEHIPALQDEYLGIVGRLIDAGIELTDGAPELIAGLADAVPVGLASNTRRSLVDRILAQTPFANAFVAITTGDEVTPKPAPDIYRLACRRIGADPAQTVAIEDSPTGVRAAQAAGLVCIGVPSDAGHPLLEADHQVTSLLQLL